tara:strand:- start:2739 stop:3485 length:747 start_codon:yes stop_codon:yes gene_type:complete
MENYISKFESLDKVSVYDFRLGEGGIGDYLKFYMIILMKCIRNDTRLYHRRNNIEIEKYIKLKHDFLYIPSSEIPQLGNATIEKPHHYYDNPTYDGDIHPNEVFYFDDAVKTNVGNILSPLPASYISIHLRLGDKFLETDMEHILCKEDARCFSPERLYRFIEDNCDKNIILFCDNNSERLKVKNKYDSIIITTSEIGHTSLSNTTNKQILDSITDFYILSNSQFIYEASHSGFSRMAARFNNTKLVS